MEPHRFLPVCTVPPHESPNNDGHSKGALDGYHLHRGTWEGVEVPKIPTTRL